MPVAIERDEDIVPRAQHDASRPRRPRAPPPTTRRPRATPGAEKRSRRREGVLLVSTVDCSRVDIILGEYGVTNAQSLSDSSLLLA